MDGVAPPRILPLDTRAPKTAEGHKKGIDKWDEFAKVQNPPYPFFGNLSVDDVCGKVLENGSMANAANPPIRKMMAEFANFLRTRKKAGGGFHQVQGMLQFFSTFKAALFKKFPPLEYAGSSPEWYSELYNGLGNRASAEAMKRGEKLRNKAVGIPRNGIVGSAKYLLKEDTAESYEERAVLTVVFSSTGRSGEVATSSWENMRYEEDQDHLANMWGDLKNGQQYDMTYVPDALGYELDVAHSLACTLVTGGSGAHKASATAEESNVNWIFPGYVDMTDGGAAAKVTRIIEKCRAGGVKGIPPEATSHGLRVGATDLMMFHDALGLPPVVARGGWEYDRESMILYYFTQRLHVTKGGRVLAGWKDPNQQTSFPTLDAIVTVQNQTQVEEYGDELFTMAPIAAMLRGELKAVRDIFLATLLMHYGEFKLDMGKDSLLIKRMHAAARQRDIQFTVIDEWGQKIKARFHLDNARNLAKTDASRIESLERQLKEQLDINKTLNAKQDLIIANQSKILLMLETMSHDAESATMSPGPARKKPRLGGDPSGAVVAFPSSAGVVASSSVAAAANANSFLAMAANQKRRSALNFAGVTEWTASKFVKEVVLQGLNPDSNAELFLGTFVNASARLRLKKVFFALRESAANDQKKYFQCRNVPVTGDARTQWFADIDTVVPPLATAMAKRLWEERLGLEGKSNDPLAVAQKMKVQTMRVSALGGLIEKVNALKNKAGRG